MKEASQFPQPVQAESPQTPVEILVHITVGGEATTPGYGEVASTEGEETTSHYREDSSELREVWPMGNRAVLWVAGWASVSQTGA